MLPPQKQLYSEGNVIYLIVFPDYQDAVDKQASENDVCPTSDNWTAGTPTVQLDGKHTLCPWKPSTGVTNLIDKLTLKLYANSSHGYVCVLQMYLFTLY